MKIEAETGIRQPEDKRHQRLPAMTGSKERSRKKILPSLQWEPSPLISYFQTSILQKCEKINFWVLSCPAVVSCYSNSRKQIQSVIAVRWNSYCSKRHVESCIQVLQVSDLGIELCD